MTDTNTTTKARGSTGLSRRRFTSLLLASGVSAPAILRASGARATDSVKMAALLDLSGGLDIYGRPMLMAMEMAVEEINATGGLNGKPLELITYDTQSNMQLYAQYAQQAALQDQVDLVHGGITSSSREVIRPILNRYNTLYLYSTQYEGGVCDQNTFCTGTTPAMTSKSPIPYTIDMWGPKFYSIGADYNAPRIMSDWSRTFGEQAGGEQVANDFFPLNVTEFGALITKIQQARPDFVCSALIGAAHLGFYRQWAAAGMLSEIPIFSFTFGSGNEHMMLPPEESEGIITPCSYFQEIDSDVNRDWVSRYHARYGDDAPYQNNVSIGGYEGTWLWATAVRNAGTAEREAVIEAMEAGTSWTGPGGTLTMNAANHHSSRDIFFGRCTGGAWEPFHTWENQQPSDTDGRCDLIANPGQNVQFGAE
ncbi:transporter substrate-binding protein [Cereibacter sphaeroides]|nr:transporter substrate-binding protein [Cereibacter sphaeroides]